MDTTGVFLGLPLPVMLAFIALLAGLILLARQLHKLRQPVVVRRAAPIQHKGSSRSD
ncbi:hypothetical protein [Massilia suwonensis]|uniref:Uncharacterized protein n=1 Tax=Massilia suwonensis TaxID=648895 RepID=A0ABW0MTQ6_9BURK